MTLTVALLAVVVVVLLAFLARLVAVVDEVELTVRTLTTAVRAAARGTKEATSTAEALGRNAGATTAVFDRLQELKNADPRQGAAT